MSAVIKADQRPSLLTKIGSKYSVEPNKMLDTLKATAFKGNVSNEQMIALLVVADQYNLNPFTREIFAFPDKQNGVVPVVSVDGWSRILNDHPQFDGVEFEFGPDKGGLPEWCEAIIYRKDRAHPIRVREYMGEVKRNTQPWASHPRRMLRHKALIQCARVALGFSGIYDQDEAERIVGNVKDVTPAPAGSRVDQVKAALGKKKPEPVIEAEAVVDAPAFDSDTGEVFDAEASQQLDQEAAQ